MVTTIADVAYRVLFGAKLRPAATKGYLCSTYQIERWADEDIADYKKRQATERKRLLRVLHKLAVNRNRLIDISESYEGKENDIHRGVRKRNDKTSCDSNSVSPVMNSYENIIAFNGDHYDYNYNIYVTPDIDTELPVLKKVAIEVALYHIYSTEELDKGMQLCKEVLSTMVPSMPRRKQ